MLDSFSQSFATLFVVIDPIGVAPIFIALTAHMTPAERRRAALSGGLIAFGILTVFGLAGDILLKALGVGLPAFRISGGLMLLLLAVEMLMEKRGERRERNLEAQASHDPTVFPLATPLIAGPGAMAAMILLVGDAQGDIAAQGAVFAVMGVVVAMVVGLALAASAVERFLAPRAVAVITRVLGGAVGRPGDSVHAGRPGRLRPDPPQRRRIEIRWIRFFLVLFGQGISGVDREADPV